MGALALPAQEYRAFELMDMLPAGCIAFPVVDQDSAPHLRLGEFAVVDTSDTAPRNGEVYVIQWDSGRRMLCQANRYKPGQTFHINGQDTWRVGSIRRGPSWEQLQAEVKRHAAAGRIYMIPGWCEAPLPQDYLQSKLVGRVIGILGASVEGPMRTVGAE